MKLERLSDLEKLRDYYEQERDRLYDEAAKFRGQKEQIDWAIRVINSFITQVEKEEKQKAQNLQKQEETLKAAKEQGNIGVHPSNRKHNLKDRREEIKQDKE